MACARGVVRSEILLLFLFFGVGNSSKGGQFRFGCAWKIVFFSERNCEIWTHAAFFYPPMSRAWMVAPCFVAVHEENLSARPSLWCSKCATCCPSRSLHVSLPVVLFRRVARLWVRWLPVCCVVLCCALLCCAVQSLPMAVSRKSAPTPSPRQRSMRVPRCTPTSSKRLASGTAARSSS